MEIPNRTYKVGSKLVNTSETSRLLLRPTTALLLLLLCVSNSPHAFAQGFFNSRSSGPGDGGKMYIEDPVKKLIRTGSPPTPSGTYIRSFDPLRTQRTPVTVPVKPRFRDMRKSITELDMKEILRSNSTSSGMPGLPDTPVRSYKSSMVPPPAVVAPVVPKIEAPGMPLTGYVLWSSNLKEAQNRSSLSGKPVFLFHMMGRLDDRFC